MPRLKVDLPLWIPFSRPLSLILIDLSFLAVARVSLRMIEGLFLSFFFFFFWKVCICPTVRLFLSLHI